MKSRAKRSASRALVEPEEEQPELDHRADRVERELERRDDAEVAAAAAQRPEQVGFSSFEARTIRPSAVTTSAATQVVAREPGLAGQPADAAAEGQAARCRCG